MHGQRLALTAAARQLELLDDVGDLLEAVHIVVLLATALRDDEKRHALEQNNLAGIALNCRLPEGTKTTFRRERVLEHVVAGVVTGLAAAATASPHQLRMFWQRARADPQAPSRWG